MPLNGLLDPLWLNTDVTLCGGGAAVLQKSLNQGDVIAAVLVDFCGIPLSEAVGTDPVVAQVVTDNVELFLYGSFGNGEDEGCSRNLMPEAVVFNVLQDDKGNGEGSLFPGLLLHNIQVKSITILYDITELQLQDITDS